MEKIAEADSSDETTTTTATTNTLTSTATSQSSLESLEVFINSNENKDTSNLKSEIIPASPKISSADVGDGKCFSILNCLPIAAESEVISVKQ